MTPNAASFDLPVVPNAMTQNDSVKQALPNEHRSFEMGMAVYLPEEQTWELHVNELEFE